MDVLEVRDKRTFLLWTLCLATCGTVGIVALEDDCLRRDVRHEDVADEHVTRHSTTTNGTLEAQTCVGAAELVVTNHKSMHSTHVLATYHETTMSMEHRVLRDENILTAPRLAFLFATTLHTNTIVTHIHRTIHDECAVTI